MTDYISREAAIKRFNFAVLDCLGMEPTIRAGDIIKALESIPAADVRPVVLCRDCDMYECHEYDGGLKYVCRLFKRQMQEADFCSLGEKREGS